MAVTRIPVYVVLPPRVLLLDVAGPLEVLRRANQLQSAVQFEVHYVAATPEVQSSIGLPVHATEPLPDDVPASAWVLVAGDVLEVMLAGPPPDDAALSVALDAAMATVSADSPAEAALVEWLRRAVGPQTTLVCICSGAVIAARAGLLDGRACTTHHASCDELKAAAPTARIQENRLYVSDGACHTCAGITAGVDLMLHLVGQLTSPSCCMAIARYLVMYVRRGGADPQLSPWLEGRNHIHPAVHRVQDAIAADVTLPWSLQSLSDIACLSDRHLSRLFNEHVGMSIVQYVNRLRVARAEDLLRRTQLSMELVAEQTGFGSVRQLRRAWHRVHAAAPRTLRMARDRHGEPGVASL